MGNEKQDCTRHPALIGTNGAVLALLLVLLPVPSSARERTYVIRDSLKYELYEEFSCATVMDPGMAVRLPVSADSTLVIPPSVSLGGRTYEVSSIASGSFCDHPEVKHLVISEGIGSVQEGAFRRCVNLESVRLPASMYVLDPSAFSYCPRLREICVEEGNEEYDSRGGCNAVMKTGESTLVKGCMGTRIPAGTTAIGQCAFSGVQGLDTLVVPEGVRVIEHGAFADCSGLRHVSLPNSLERMGGLAFHGCSSLGEVHIPEGVRHIGGDEYAVFSGCLALKRITVSPGNRWFDSREDCNAIVSTQADSVVAGCGGSRIVEGVRRIGYKAFAGSALDRIYIPASVTSIEERAFWDCPSCSSIEVAPGNPVYDSRGGCNAIIETATGTLFKGCRQTEIPQGVTAIGPYAFARMSLHGNLVLPEGITELGASAFAGNSLGSVRLPRSLRKVGQAAFLGNTWLVTVDSDAPEMEVERGAFQFCHSLQAVHLPRRTLYADSLVFQYSPYQEVFDRECAER